MGTESLPGGHETSHCPRHMRTHALYENDGHITCRRTRPGGCTDRSHHPDERDLQFREEQHCARTASPSRHRSLPHVGRRLQRPAGTQGVRHRGVGGGPSNARGLVSIVPGRLSRRHLGTRRRIGRSTHCVVVWASDSRRAARRPQFGGSGKWHVRVSLADVLARTGNPLRLGSSPYQRRKPPSLSRTWPTIQRPSSLTSQPTSRAGSSGSPNRPDGKCSRILCQSSSAMSSSR